MSNHRRKHTEPPCICTRLAFPHRHDWRCDTWQPDDATTARIGGDYDDELAAFNAAEARSINRDYYR